MIPFIPLPAHTTEGDADNNKRTRDTDGTDDTNYATEGDAAHSPPPPPFQISVVTKIPGRIDSEQILTTFNVTGVHVTEVDYTELGQDYTDAIISISGTVAGETWAKLVPFNGLAEWIGGEEEEKTIAEILMKADKTVTIKVREAKMRHNRTLQLQVKSAEFESLRAYMRSIGMGMYIERADLVAPVV